MPGQNARGDKPLPGGIGAIRNPRTHDVAVVDCEQQQPVRRVLLTHLLDGEAALLWRDGEPDGSPRFVVFVGDTHGQLHRSQCSRPVTDPKGTSDSHTVRLSGRRAMRMPRDCTDQAAS
jgi:hypothetical protein